MVSPPVAWPIDPIQGRQRPQIGRLVAVVVVGVGLAAGCGDGADRAEPGVVDPVEPADADEGPPAGDPVEVLRLADGDSGLIALAGEEIEFRLLGYNAPERFEGSGGPESCNGAAAEAALAERLGSAGPSLRFVGGETDRFGRRLGDFVVDGRSVVEDLVSGGWGLATGEEARRDLMVEAADAGRGIWGAGCGTAAADGLVIDRVEPDPPGRDEDDLNGEFVELRNDGSEVIDLSGWDIRDDSSSHRFDLAGTIAPGERLVVRTGQGRSGGGELFLDASSPVWSNRGDSVLIIDPDGVVAAWAFF